MITLFERKFLLFIAKIKQKYLICSCIFFLFCLILLLINKQTKVVRINLANIYANANPKVIIDDEESASDHEINVVEEEEEVVYNNKSKKNFSSNSIESDEQPNKLVTAYKSSTTNTLKHTRDTKSLVKSKIVANPSLGSHSSTNYVFKVKIRTQDKTLSSESINVKCEKMNTMQDASGSFIGLILTSVCAVTIAIVAFLFCLIVKK